MADRSVMSRNAGPRLPTDPVAVADISHVETHGYVILPSILPLEEVQAAKAEIMRLSGSTPLAGRNPFEGLDTTRIYSLLNKTRVFDKLVVLPRVLALNDYFLDPGYQLTAFHTIQINPGEQPQDLHHDDGFCHFPRPRGPLGTAIMVAFDEFTAENGATRVIPGSHLWGSERPRKEQAIPMVCPAGSVIYFIGTTWHGGGPNTSTSSRMSATVQYCQPYIRSLENQFLAVDPRRLPEIDTRIVEMMGYKIHQPFVGYGMSSRPVLATGMPPSEADLANIAAADGLSPVRGARRMVEWLQKPLDKNPPAFPDHGTGKSKL
ncbi:hypothetical protein V501_05519 [Pseudogymnoascus sp. VKM F-4519 (FW-2642)]|nr:hypothetical protein V501_05519 [Pseudogymnoascus sp. VKM F-4519 (FW-2642)]